MKDTLVEQILDIERSNPEKIFASIHSLKHPIIQINYATLVRESFRYCGSILNKLPKAKNTVIILMDLSPDLFFAFIGSIFAGQIPSIFAVNTSRQNPDLFRKSMETLVHLSEGKLIICTPSMKKTLDELQIDIQVLAPDEIEAASSHVPEKTKADDIAFLQHSSGTTGLKKGVALTHRQVMNQINHLAEALHLQNQDRIASWLPLYHDMGLIAAFILPLLTAVPVEYIDTFEWVANPHLLFKVISETQSTLCWQPNFSYIFLANRVQDNKLTGVKLESIRAFINSAEPITEGAHHKFLQRFQSLGVKEKSLFTMYAMAENVFAVTFSDIGKTPAIVRADLEEFKKNGRIKLSENGKVFISSGSPIRNTKIKIVDAQGIVLNDGFLGEILIQSDCLFKEYLHRPDATQIAFDQGWYRSGDLGFLMGQELFVIGRKSDMLIIAGKNVYPQDIEDIVSEIPGIHPGRVTVFGIDNEEKGTQELVILAEPDFEDPKKLLQLELEIRKEIAQLTEVTVDRLQFVPRMWLVKSTSGKISRSGSRDKWLNQFNRL